MVNTGAARDRPVAMATQEIHFASMAQLVESSPMLLAIKETQAHDGISSMFHSVSLDDKFPSSSAR